MLRDSQAQSLQLITETWLLSLADEGDAVHEGSANSKGSSWASPPKTSTTHGANLLTRRATKLSRARGSEEQQVDPTNDRIRALSSYSVLLFSGPPMSGRLSRGSYHSRELMQKGVSAELTAMTCGA